MRRPQYLIFSEPWIYFRGSFLVINYETNGKIRKINLFLMRFLLNFWKICAKIDNVNNTTKKQIK